MAAAMEVQTEPPNPPRQGYQQHVSAPHLPASPTLTNPDMILPEDERPVSPGVNLDDCNMGFSTTVWKSAHTVGGVGSDMMKQFNFYGGTLDQPGPDFPYGPTAPITPTTPIIYGNGTMLSDIGEVTEVESTPGKPSPESIRKRSRRDSSTSGHDVDGALRSSPTMGFETMKNRQSKILAAKRERRLSNESIDSTSTITTKEKRDVFADFDDSVSVEDSVFQGDDEESVAESYLEPAPELELRTARLAVPFNDNSDRLSVTSSTSIGRRAEEILANAKEKLTKMESNLTRAKSTLPMSPTRSSLTSGSTPSPPRQRASTAINVRRPDSSSPPYSPGHSRFISDHTHALASVTRIGTQRSASAMGTSGGYRQPLVGSKSAEPMRHSLEGVQRHGSERISPPSRSQRGSLEPLTEDGALLISPAGPVTPQSAKLEQFLSPTFGGFGSGGIQRSASVTQVRELKDQVQGLKGKISSLREQARLDSLKRRSLQSLRTPSPFTHAQVDQWYAESRPSPLTSELGSPTGLVRGTPWDKDPINVDEANEAAVVGDVKEESAEEEESIYTDSEHRTQLRPPTSYSTRRTVAEKPQEAMVNELQDGQHQDLAQDVPAVGEAEEETQGLIAPAVEEEAEADDGEDDLISDMHTENGDDEDDDTYGSESGESLYHDTMQHPISHEDREDAFDYEHFFLHSAMGTISQQRLARRGSSASYLSEDSVETTRGPMVNSNSNGNGIGADESGSSDGMDEYPTLLRARRNSDDSISTIGTFATAHEGSGGNTPADERGGEFPSHVRSRPGSRRSRSTEPARRTDLSRPSTAARHSVASFKSIPEEDGKETEDPFANFNHFKLPVARRPMSSQATTPSAHRPSGPSVSSFESTGTTRSFPLVNRGKANSVGMLTPQSSSPDQELKALSDSLLEKTASTIEQQRQQDQDQGTGEPKQDRGRSGSLVAGSATKGPLPQAIQALQREDHYLVERLVANLGRCVLGLTEHGKASAESRMYRRRIDAARRILEGLDQV